ncbi:MAG: sel1 repeat family protein, partial [Oscillospiraceae bacterium]|nr:sel1 repeat family protein [Oscillospiraceae bacterium]
MSDFEYGIKQVGGSTFQTRDGSYHDSLQGARDSYGSSSSSGYESTPYKPYQGLPPYTPEELAALEKKSAENKAYYANIVLTELENLGDYLQKCKVWIENGNYDSAINIADQVYAKHSDDYANYIKGMAYLAKGDLDNALTFTNNAIRGISYENGTESYQHHREMLAGGLKHAERVALYHNARGNVLLRMGKKYEKKAKKDFKVASKYYSNEYICLGDIFIKTKGGAEYDIAFSAYKNEDYSTAVKWTHKSAELGNKNAMCSLGNFYYNGQIVEENIESAIEWYKKAAELGHSEAIEHLKTICSAEPPPKDTSGLRSANENTDKKSAEELYQEGLLHYDARSFAQAVTAFPYAA